MLLEWLVRKSRARLPPINMPPLERNIKISYPTLSTLSHIFCSIVVARLCLHCCTEVLSHVCFTQNFDLLTFSAPDDMARNFLPFTFRNAHFIVSVFRSFLSPCSHVENKIIWKEVGLNPGPPCSSSDRTGLILLEQDETEPDDFFIFERQRISFLHHKACQKKAFEMVSFKIRRF